ncbi:MAG: nucleotidyltransferase domain-containing protein [Candidatus Micrarchaeota archaeon]|nr:nucleotidyltransferase domain-containing protein [Candidatus Micrarchaeota archaeon]
MAETKIYLSSALDANLREAAMKRFGFGKGSISNAASEAITQWLAREDLIKSTLEAIISIAKQDKNAVAVILFGSYARKEPNYRDIDVAILLRQKSGSAALEPYSKRVSRLFDLSILNGLPDELQSRIFEEGTVIYSKDNALLHDLSMKAARSWSDFRWLMGSSPR